MYKVNLWRRWLETVPVSPLELGLHQLPLDKVGEITENL